MMQPTTAPRPKSIFVEFWFVFLFIGAMVALILAYILRLLTPAGPQSNTWNNITPGLSDVNDVTKNFGQPLSQESYGPGQRLQYQSQYPTRPHDVITDQSGTVQFIKEYLPLDSQEFINTSIEQYGEPDYVLIDEITGDAFRAYVFLDQGLVLIAHIADDSVQQKWYFVPTSADNFLQSWGQSLTNEEPSPEEFGPID